VAPSSRRRLRADLHVHTRHSRLEALPVLGARDCYSEPREAYLRAKARGMDLVTFTDHDTIDGCLELLSEEGNLPDFFISEEVSARDPVTGCRLHVNVFGIDERTHGEIRRLRGNVRELLPYLEQEGIPAALNHIGSSLVRERVPGRDLVALAGLFPLVETRNGAQREGSNGLAASLADALGKGSRPVGRTGGSDAHTSRRIGWAWTEAEAADRTTFLSALRGGRTVPRGESARLAPLVHDVYRVVLSYYRDLAGNHRSHFSPEGRRKAAACALLSLPLHLVALPALGTLVRQFRVHGAALRHCRDLARAMETGPGDSMVRAESRNQSGLREAGFPALPEMAWVPGPESEGA
jgi:predicted metal-dependent phosphoesterase TrpH